MPALRSLHAGSRSGAARLHPRPGSFSSRSYFCWLASRPAAPPPLLIAAGDRDVARVVELLDAGADPNVRDSLGQTALQSAAFDGDDEIVRLLLDNGAIVDFRGDTPLTPLMIRAATTSPPCRRDAVLASSWFFCCRR